MTIEDLFAQVREIRQLELKTKIIFEIAWYFQTNNYQEV